MAHFHVKDDVLVYYSGAEEYLIIPEGVTKIGARTFEGDENLRHVVIPDGVTEIGDGAFSMCSALECIWLPNTLKSIGNNAFGYCTKLTQVALPKGLRAIGEEAFIGCISLCAMEIPEGVESLLDCTFKDCEMLQRVLLPDSLLRVGIAAFRSCANLSDITLPPRLTAVGASAFHGCESLRKRAVPDGVDQLEHGLFFGCRALEEVCFSPKVTRIESWVFCGCRRLKKISDMAQVKQVGACTFFGCDALADENGFIIFNDILFYCVIDTPTVAVPTGVREIGAYAFSKKRHLKTLLLPEGVETIARMAFYESALSVLHLPSTLTTITEDVFEKCHTLSYFVIAGEYARLWVLLKKTMLYAPNALDFVLTLSFFKQAPDFLLGIKGEREHIKKNRKKYIHMAMEIGDAALLEQLFSVTRKPTLYEIDTLLQKAEGNVAIVGFLLQYKRNQFSEAVLKRHEQAKLACTLGFREKTITELKREYSFDETAEGIRLKSYKGNDTVVFVPERIGKKPVVEIAPECFCARAPRLTAEKKENRQAIRELYVPEGVHFIGKRAFAYLTQLEHIVLPTALEKIEEEAFMHCERLWDIRLPKHLKCIGKGAFFLCLGLRELCFAPPLKRIEAEAFYGCMSLTRVQLPMGAVTLERGAFWNCEKLADINVTPGRHKITDMTFLDCPGLKDKDGFVILDDMLYGCFSDKTHIRVPDTVRRISSFAFHEQDVPESVTIGENVTQMGDWTFHDCRRLQTLQLPPKLTYVPDYMCSGCVQLQSVVLPQHLKTIGNCAFRSCERLEHCALPKSLEKIGAYAFSFCAALAELSIPRAVKSIDSNAFGACDWLVLQCADGSFGLCFAKRRKIPFVVAEE